MSFYLDASVLLPKVVREPGTAAVDRFLAGASDELIVSEFAAAEVASAMSRLVRMGLSDREAAHSMLADFDVWRATVMSEVDIQPADVRAAHLLVRRFELMLRTPDALHLAISMRCGFRLVTLDKRLAAAAGAIGVYVIQPV